MPRRVERLLVACDAVCDHDPESWRYLLWGLWESGLRVAEAISLNFDIPGTIQVTYECRDVVLQIPGKRQKNRRRQLVPTIPSFAALLESHPMLFGYVFDPTARGGQPGRMTVRHVSRVNTRIGEKAGAIVNENGKPASAHDLRRSFGQRLADAGVAPRDLQKAMRHRRLETTEQYDLRDDALDIADRIADKLGSSRSLESVPRYTSEIEPPNRVPR